MIGIDWMKILQFTIMITHLTESLITPMVRTSSILELGKKNLEVIPKSMKKHLLMELL